MFSDAEILRKVPLLQITLGGEVIDQPILEQAAAEFPERSISSHICYDRVRPMLFRERWIEWLPRRLFEWRAA